MTGSFDSTGKEIGTTPVLIVNKNFFHISTAPSKAQVRKALKAVPDEKNMGSLKAKQYFCGGGGGWLFFNPVGDILCENVTCR